MGHQPDKGDGGAIGSSGIRIQKDLLEGQLEPSPLPALFLPATDFGHYAQVTLPATDFGHYAQVTF